MSIALFYMVKEFVREAIYIALYFQKYAVNKKYENRETFLSHSLIQFLALSVCCSKMLPITKKSEENVKRT